ncbi:MAG: nuclear transport factor 2 family protein [Ferruginibacter sp.]
MKKVIATSILILTSFTLVAQNPAEAEIRKLEKEIKEAFLKKDTGILFKLFSPDFVVHAPNHKIITFQQLKPLIQNGSVDRDVFEKITEVVTFNNNIAIAMGHETLRPTGNAQHAGKTVKRRYTNVWMKTNDNWQLVARQSTIISVE